MQLFFGGVLILSLPLALVLLGCTEREIADLDVVAQEVEAEGLASEDLEPDRYEFQATPCAQSVQDVDFIEWMTETIPALPPADSDTYLAPTFLEKQQFKAAAAALLEGRCQSAWSLAGQAGFRVVELRDKAARYLYLEPLDRVQKARGIFLVRVHDQWDSEVVMEAPHPLFDQGTGLLAAMAFAQGNFAALAIAGTHRCANIDYGQADGKTRVCNEGLRHPYRESDMAHAAQSYFQAFHEAFAAACICSGGR